VMAVAVGTGSCLPAPRTDPGVQYYRTGLLGCARFRAKESSPFVSLFPAGTWCKAFQLYLSGPCDLCRLRATVSSFPL
jgi:hypothetical protein